MLLLLFWTKCYLLDQLRIRKLKVFISLHLLILQYSSFFFFGHTMQLVGSQCPLPLRGLNLGPLQRHSFIFKGYFTVHKIQTVGWWVFSLNTKYFTPLSSCLHGFWEVVYHFYLCSSIGKVFSTTPSQLQRLSRYFLYLWLYEA